MKNKLSSRSYWDGVLKNTKLPREYSLSQYNIFRFDKLFKQYISPRLPRSSSSFFEVGCGSSAWLPYFQKTFDLHVGGLDYSEEGCVIARENLKIIFGLDATSDIHCVDLLDDKSITRCGTYDIAFSYGVIEHFKDAAHVVQQISKLVKPTGMIITVVPNLNGLNGLITRIFFSQIYAIHNRLDCKQLRECHAWAGFAPSFVGYFGSFYVYVIPWQKIELRWLSNKILRRLFLRLIRTIDKIATWALRLTQFEFESRLLSPYVVYIGTKIKT